MSNITLKRYLINSLMTNSYFITCQCFTYIFTDKGIWPFPHCTEGEQYEEGANGQFICESILVNNEPAISQSDRITTEPVYVSTEPAYVTTEPVHVTTEPAQMTTESAIGTTYGE